MANSDDILKINSPTETPEPSKSLELGATPDPTPGHEPRPTGLTEIARVSVQADLDEIDKKIAIPEHENESNFKKSTEVIYVNGIGTNEIGSEKEALAYANLTHHRVTLLHDQTHGKLVDVGIAIRETNVPGFAEAGRPEQLLAAELLTKAGRGQDVHIAAYSRGALITEHAIALADATLLNEGRSPEYVRNDFHAHLTLETFNGASHNVADGIRAVHYVNTKDLAVGNNLGMGPLTPISRTAEESLLGPTVTTAYSVSKGVANSPNGPVIMVDAGTSLNPIDEHSAYLIFGSKQYQPIENAYAPYARLEQERLSVHPDPSAMPGPKADLHIFTNGAQKTVSDGFSETGTLFDYGNFVGQQSERNGQKSVTMYSKAELFESMSLEQRDTMRSAIAHHAKVEIRLDHSSLTIVPHDASAHTAAPSHALEQSRSKAPTHELGR